MCNCITIIKEKALANYREGNEFNKPVESVGMREVTFPIIANTIEMRTYTTLDVELEGAKRKQMRTIIHTFCPFCGEKYGAHQQPADQD